MSIFFECTTTADEHADVCGLQEEVFSANKPLPLMKVRRCLTKQDGQLAICLNIYEGVSEQGAVDGSHPNRDLESRTLLNRSVVHCRR